MSEKSLTKGQQNALAYNETFSCVQCGYCLPACPTYLTMGKETHSPRGRINLVKMAAEGRFTNLDLLSDSIDKCLGCRACETACPVGVDYGKIYESAKHALEESREYSKPVRLLRSLLFDYLFPSKPLLRIFGSLLWLYQRTGIQTVVRKTKLLSYLPSHLDRFEAILPAVSSPVQHMKRPRHRTTTASPRYKVAFFTGCVMDVMYEKVNRLSMELLQQAGCEVIIMPGETCCGALHAHAGERQSAIKLAKQNIEAYERLGKKQDVDFIVNSIGGCGAQLKEYDHLFHEEANWYERSQAFAAKTKDISEILVMADPLPFKQDEQVKREIVTYQRSCHMSNVQKVQKPPLELLRSIPYVELREMNQKDLCCGSAGIYNMVNYEESMDILDDKMIHVKKTSAHTIVTTNPGCQLQLEMGVRREDMQGKVRVVHLVELLAEACGIE
jgi:glycolate oxidase iron-sulfur subunit